MSIVKIFPHILLIVKGGIKPDKCMWTYLFGNNLRYTCF